MLIMEKNTDIIKHSKLEIMSYSFGGFAREFIVMAFNTFVFFFYEREIGLNVWLIGLALVIFAIYNMFNDPIIGYLTNRTFFFTKKWGRRFPWLILGGLPWGLTYILVFTPPVLDPVSGAWILFLWLIFTTCLFDTFHSLFFVNFSALFPDKFRSIEERRTASGFEIAIAVFGVALGAILPPLFISFGNLNSYFIQGIVIFLVCLVGIILGIPGFREDQVLIDKYIEEYDIIKKKKSSFFRVLMGALKQRPFVAFIIFYTMYQTLINCMTASIPYVVDFVLDMPSNTTTIIFAGFLIGVLISIPFWVKLSHKINNNKKIMTVSGILITIFTFPLIFIETLTPILINMIIWGIALGGYWFMIFPVLSDVIDHSISLTEKREEGIYSGFQQFFGRIGIMLQALIFAVAHGLTGFVEGQETQTPLAIWSIHIHLALAPMILFFIGCLIFWKYYNLTPEKIAQNQEKIRQMALKS